MDGSFLLLWANALYPLVVINKSTAAMMVQAGVEQQAVL